MSDVAAAHSKVVRVGVVGTSKRAAACFRNLSAEAASSIRVVGLADPDETKRRRFEELFCQGYSPAHHDQGAQMLGGDSAELDGVIIASPNACHAADAERAISMGLTTLLEKPVAISVSECRQLWHAWSRADSRDRSKVIVGFVLRYTPFYAKVKEIIGSGRLGQILTIDADESLGTALSAEFHKGWRRSDAVSGGFIVEKCCHDLDMLNWLVGARARRVFSMGNRAHFVPRPRDEQHARFDTVAMPQFDADYGDNQIKEAFFTPSDGSPYEVSADSPDHQTVMLEYEQGTLCTLTAAMAQPRTGRRLRVYGTNGSLEGNLDDAGITMYWPHEQGNGWRREELSVKTNSSGHHGGDAIIGEAFWQTAATGVDHLSRAGIPEGIEAVLLGSAAEQSRKTGQPVEMDALRAEAFGVHGNEHRGSCHDLMPRGGDA